MHINVTGYPPPLPAKRAFSPIARHSEGLRAQRGRTEESHTRFFAYAQDNGFSLVELSIVLVILGLLTGGILTGQNLIRAAELRSVTTEFQALQTAAMTFRDKYFALPGDMTNAETFWGSMTNCGAASPSGTGTQTCNGDGDGVIALAPAAQTGENHTFWQQLSNANLLEGSYSGISGPSGEYISGVNVPKSRLGNNALWAVAWYGPRFSHPDDFDGNYRNVFALRNNNDSPGPGINAGVLTTEEAWNIDTKIDDGFPGQGNVRARKTSKVPGCVSSDDAVTAAYVLNNNNVVCVLNFESGS